jgi:glycosyltransferase involved in cell wall biosynthesis
MGASATTDTTPLVSVVMPTYKRQAYLRTALESAVHQTYQNLEILIGDNENSSVTAELVASLNDPRITYLGREDNLGMIGNNLDLFQRATGKYVVNLHDDDAWREDFLEKMVAVLEAHDSVNIAFSDYFVIDAKGEIDFKLTEQTMHDHKRDVLKPGLHQDALRIALVERAVPTTLCGLMRREGLNLEGFPVEVGNVYDLWLCYLALAGGAGVYYLPERLAFRRVHPDADSTWSFINLNRNTIYCYTHFLNDHRLKACFEDFHDWVGTCCARLGTMLLEQGKAREAREWLREGLRHKPSSRALIGLVISYVAGRRTSTVVHSIQALLAQWRRFRSAQPEQVQHSLREH